MNITQLNITNNTNDKNKTNEKINSKTIINELNLKDSSKTNVNSTTFKKSSSIVTSDSELRNDKVELIKAQINNGTFNINSKKVADNLLKSTIIKSN